MQSQSQLMHAMEAGKAEASAPGDMDAEQAAFYDVNGYLVVENAIEPSLVARLNEDYDRKVAEAARNFEGNLTDKAGAHPFRESSQHTRFGVQLWSPVRPYS
jgi:ectoine hydroxylase-related dioxygenase (phytanoyl-CoA dioxygenase family)